MLVFFREQIPANSLPKKMLQNDTTEITHRIPLLSLEIYEAYWNLLNPSFKIGRFSISTSLSGFLNHQLSTVQWIVGFKVCVGILALVATMSWVGVPWPLKLQENLGRKDWNRWKIIWPSKTRWWFQRFVTSVVRTDKVKDKVGFKDFFVDFESPNVWEMIQFDSYQKTMGLKPPTRQKSLACWKMKVWTWKRTFDIYDYDWGFSICHDWVSPYKPNKNPWISY